MAEPGGGSRSPGGSMRPAHSGVSADARRTADQRIRAAFVTACRLDVDTPKPGNVSVDSEGHGMSAAQFIASAEAAADALLVPGAPVGQRLLDAVTRTRATVGCNTNLGILLLVAPLAAALEEAARPLSAQIWQAATERVLARLDIEDARLAYRAIALANPGGLGEAPEQSVHDAPTVGLRDAMLLAAGRDSIARQYAEGFRDIFETGLAALREVPADQPRASAPSAAPAAAVVTAPAAAPNDTQDDAPAAALNVFLTFLGAWPDSHILRKHGAAVAQSVTLAARAQHAQWRSALCEAGRAAARAPLDVWDTELKAAAINPGTSADLTVATLFVALCLDEPGNASATERAPEA
ncbi:MAG: Triphosphoribosyl-dephospho-CoA synthetase [uncultured Paraburkholderia sp.]|nr:MAG: Triphosphoribosyl-dephospho-CoA synthetase [uncultured Paraburkholderia sp.]CAH2912132.1 MAG: Triphosphoribosyl-dephospho-CoA synthetase [uncultured Paraburkholderia sp.]